MGKSINYLAYKKYKTVGEWWKKEAYKLYGLNSKEIAILDGKNER